MARSFLDSWVNRLKASAREEIQETARGAALYVILYAVAAVAALIAVVFLTLAAFWWLAAETSAIPAALIITAFYAILAGVVLIWASWSGDATAKVQPPSEQAGDIEYLSAVEPGGMPEAMGLSLDTVSRTLAGAGFRTESLVVSASSEVLKNLTPLQFAGLVFVASFIFGRRLRRR